jgi:hypothetical protein
VAKTTPNFAGRNTKGRTGSVWNVVEKSRFGTLSYTIPEEAEGWAAVSGMTRERSESAAGAIRSRTARYCIGQEFRV